MTGAGGLDPAIVRTLQAKADQVSVAHGPLLDELRSIDASVPPAQVIRLTPPRPRRSRVAVAVAGIAVALAALGFGGWAGCASTPAAEDQIVRTDASAVPPARQHGRS